jgi:alkane 1-monooxygenase
LGGIWLGGLWTYGAVIFAYVLIPVLDQLIPQSVYNYSDSEKQQRLSLRFFDVLLYLNLPMNYAIIAFFVYKYSQGGMTNNEITGNILSIGIALGACGINVAHELGHRTNFWERLIAKGLLIPTHYTHFIIEHNLGHHRHVATPNDPATAKRNEIVFVFWFRSWILGYLNAWKIQMDLLKKRNAAFFSLDNEMLLMQLAQVGFFVLVFAVSDAWTLLWVALAGMVGFLLLETINYIEHYGIQRELLASGRYERVQAHHSWNSEHQLGRMVLYELTRHSDHHFIANKKYQILDHHDDAPQLPLGYPASMLLSFVPPLWFAVMNRKLAKAAG